MTETVRINKRETMYAMWQWLVKGEFFATQTETKKKETCAAD